MILKHLRFQHLKNHSDLFLVGKVFRVSWLSQLSQGIGFQASNRRIAAGW